MSERFTKQLLAQAEGLARRERKRPQQVSLRRAVSTAYYALFHFLVDQAGRCFLGTTHANRGLRVLMARGFQHGVMKEASKTFAGGTLPDWIKVAMPGQVVPKDLKVIADTFVRLQEERHRADYNLSGTFTRQETFA